MKINKVIFSTSPEFSVYWNLISKVYESKLRIFPVCLLFGQKAGLNLSERYGQVIEVPINPDLPLLIQITWSKFYHVLSEPDTTWMIGDIDMFPLCKHHFTTDIESVPDDHYVHLDAEDITQFSGTPWTWTGRGQLHAGNIPDRVSHDTNLTAHYHVAKGYTFQKCRDHLETFEDELRYIMAHPEYHGTREFRPSDPIEQANLWAAEESRSTDLVRNGIRKHGIKFTGFKIAGMTERISPWAPDRYGGYVFDEALLKAGRYIDVHCARPFDKFLPETMHLLEVTGMV